MVHGRHSYGFLVCLGHILAQILWQFGGVELESKALTKIPREEGDCVSQFSVLFIFVVRNRLHRENSLPFPFY